MVLLDFIHYFDSFAHVAQYQPMNALPNPHQINTDANVLVENPSLSEEIASATVAVVVQVTKPASDASATAPTTKPTRFWETDKLKYTPTNIWSRISKEKRESARLHDLRGLEVRDLPEGHFLHGEKGLFATIPFKMFDVIGEYCGKIVDNTVQGHYVAVLEEKPIEESLGIDAEHIGNEMRFINSYLNVAPEANVLMRTVYMNTLPHLVIVCKRDIEVGEEILLDYGDGYTNTYLTPNIRCIKRDPVPWKELAGGSSSDEEDN